MKNFIVYVLSGVFLLGIGSCQKTKDEINNATAFDLNYSSTASMPATPYTPSLPPVDITTPEVPTNSAKAFSDNKTSTDLVSEIKLTKLDMTTSGTDFNFLKSIAVYLKSGASEQKVAEKTTIPAGVKTISLDLVDVNIKEYIFKDKIQFRVSSTLAAGTSSSQDIKLDETVHVKATLIK